MTPPGTPGPLEPSALLGRWGLTRGIDDRYAGEQLRVVGTLSLDRLGEPASPGIDWVEEGLLHRPGRAPVAVGRRLRVVRRDGAGDGRGDWWVCFADGRDFHPWRPGTWVEHPCGPDLYRGLVEAHAALPGARATAWRVTWQVCGPRKDYTMTTGLRRLVE